MIVHRGTEQMAHKLHGGSGTGTVQATLDTVLTRNKILQILDVLNYSVLNNVSFTMFSFFYL